MADEHLCFESACDPHHDVSEIAKEIVIEEQQVDFGGDVKKRISRRCVVDGCLNNNTSHTMYAFPRVQRLMNGKHVVDQNWMER